jgi:geranylgeranyl diphosphate/geranylgeranyl-bacteriochlorophyllide a reductase
MREDVDFLIVGAGPAGATAAREAARRGIETVVLEKDAVVGAKRVCAAGLRPDFCRTFDLPRSLIHCDTPRLALFDSGGREHEVSFGPGHTTTREELDGEIARLATGEGAHIRTHCLLRGLVPCENGTIVEYADLRAGERRTIRARNVFLAHGATARLTGALADARWESGLMTTLQYRVYLDRPADPIAYRTLELHYYPASDGRQIVAWMFPKRDHLAIGLGLVGKLDGATLRNELDAFTSRVAARLYAHAKVTRVKQEGHLLYGGWPRSRYADGGAMLGGTAAGLVDATNGEGIFEAAISGRFAAESVAAERHESRLAAESYAARLRSRFVRRLEHRVRLMQYLQARPNRYGLLFSQLAGSPRFADALQKEDHERTPFDRFVLSVNAAFFATRASFA